jgi:hypothetical protein
LDPEISLFQIFRELKWVQAPHVRPTTRYDGVGEQRQRNSRQLIAALWVPLTSRARTEDAVA